MTITTTRYSPGTSTVIDTTTTVVSFTASGSSEPIDHDVEVNASYDCEDTSAVTVEV